MSAQSRALCWSCLCLWQLTETAGVILLQICVHTKWITDVWLWGRDPSPSAAVFKVEELLIMWTFMLAHKHIWITQIQKAIGYIMFSDLHLFPWEHASIKSKLSSGGLRDLLWKPTMRVYQSWDLEYHVVIPVRPHSLNRHWPWFICIQELWEFISQSDTVLQNYVMCWRLHRGGEWYVH